MCKRLVCLTTLVSLLALAVAGRADAADPNLAGWWKLDGDATDSSGNGIHGTINGDPQWVAGVVGGAGSFDGVDDWIDLGNPPSLPSGKAPRSVCAWALTNSLGSAWGIVAGYGATGTGQGNGLGRQGAALSAFGMGTAVRVENFWQVGVWYHLCMTFDGTVGTLYANGVPLLSQEKPDWNLVLNRARIGRQINDNPEFWIGLIDDVRFYSRALTDRDIQAVMRGVGQEQAIAPQPQSEAVDVPRDVVMSWTASEFAATHDVYFGTAFEDVNSASRANPLNAPVSQGQEANTYDPGRLEFGQTYYWRIDEVNAPPDNTIFKGEVWSFTVEPIAYPIAPASIIATASSSNSNDEDPNKTIDRSGLDPDDLHSAENADMWLSGTSEPQSAWIQYEFDRAYKLHEMWVWNHNTLSEATVGFGIKDAVIQYSADGLEWVTLGTTHEFARAPGAPGYAHNTVVDFGDVVVRCVKITANSNWRGILEQYGLSEVRFLYVPVWAREASPDSGAADVAVDATLGWRAGREAAGHEVYVST